jgi:hypothetical protein
MEVISGRTIIGLDEMITLIYEEKDGSKHEFQVLARIDTGADSSSIDKVLFYTLPIRPIVTTKTIKSASGIAKRDVTVLKIKIKDKLLDAKFNIADRSKLKYKMLIGQNLLKEGFLIDPQKKRLIL